MSSAKDSIVFILCRTQFASNLGAAARVMRNMGLSRLVLVAPQCEVGMEARTRAMKGAEILDRAEVLPSLEAAGRSVGLLAGASGRFGPREPRWMESPTFCSEVLPGALPGRVGIAFGPEDNGLSREEAELCRWLIEIPTGSDYGVLNLAQSVGIVAYDIHLALRRSLTDRAPNEADPRHVTDLLKAVEAALRQSGYGERAPLPAIMRRLEKLASRARLEVEDVNLFRGLLRRLPRQ